MYSVIFKVACFQGVRFIQATKIFNSRDGTFQQVTSDLLNLCFGRKVYYVIRYINHIHFGLLQMLAWNPRSYLADFEDILPALMSPSTAIEVRNVYHQQCTLSSFLL